MFGLWNNVTTKIHHKISENWINAMLLLAPVIDTYSYAQYYRKKERNERQHRQKKLTKRRRKRKNEKLGKDLSDDQVSSMKEAFTLFDTDGNGKIAPSELGILMRSLGGNPTQAQLKSIIAEEKLNAPFDFARFLDLMSKHLKPEPFDRQLRDAFKVLDKEGTGFVVVSNLWHIRRSYIFLFTGK